MLESLRNDILDARQPRCMLGRFMRTLESKDQAVLQQLLDDFSVSAGEIAGALRSYTEGTSFRINSQGVGRHRRRGGANGCTCP